MRFNPDVHYLVIKRKSVAQLFDFPGERTDFASVRAWLIPFLRRSAVVDEREPRMGRAVRFEGYEPRLHTGVRVQLMFAHGPDGAPLLAPDGRKHVVFVETVELVPGMAPPCGVP